MRRRGYRWALCVSIAVAAAVATADGARAAGPGPTPAPVASLDPAATARLWHGLVTGPRRPLARAADCRPLRGVFYASTDWLRLATKLAATASPCAEYYISIPPLVADKTQPRPDQAWRIRALGPSFHALAEIHFAAWTSWVASTGSTWYAAGVTARQRMAAAGYDVSKGDTWVVNEFTSAIRRGDGAARANARDFVRGLHDGEGGPPTRGAVFVVGISQATADLSVYQTNLQNWLADSAFWTDMAAYVSDWSQEVYGDFRNHGVPGAPAAARRDYLNDYLQHELVLASVAPPAVEPARSFLQSAYSPLANAAWQWDFGYGWTMVSAEQMQGFVSTQTYALRFFSALNGQPRDHWGFAWSPRNATGLAQATFAAQTGAVLDRLAAAVRDSGQPLDPNDPGSGACGPPGQNVFCTGDLEGARFTETWKSFRTWTQPVLAFTTPPQTIAAGAPSAAMSVALLTSTGAPQIAAVETPVIVSSSSPQGTFSAGPSGPWTTTLTVSIPAGSNASGPFYYQDTRAGAPVLSAVAAGTTTGTQAQIVTPGPPVSVAVSPASVTVAARASQPFAVAGTDAFGNVFPVAATWSVTPPALGSIAPQTGDRSTFTAGTRAGSGSVVAAVATGAGALSGSARVTVTPGRLRVASIRYGIGRKALLVTPLVVDVRGRPVARAVVSVVVRRKGRRYFTGRAATAANGRVTFRLPGGRGACYTTAIARASAAGFVWDRKTPRNKFCK